MLQCAQYLNNCQTTSLTHLMTNTPSYMQAKTVERVLLMPMHAHTLAGV
jgi:hypothetical protein